MTENDAAQLKNQTEAVVKMYDDGMITPDELGSKIITIAMSFAEKVEL